MQNFLGLDMKKLLDPKAVTFILGFWVFFYKLSHHKSATLTLIFTSRTSFFPESYMNPMKSWNFKKFHDLGDWVIKTTFFLIETHSMQGWTATSRHERWLRRTPHNKTLYYGPHSKWKTIFLGRNSKSGSSAFRNFFIYQNFKGSVWVMNLFLSGGMFFIKKVYFPAKAAVRGWKTYQALLSPEL